MNHKRNILLISVIISIIFTVLLYTVDVQPVGLIGSNIGFASLNTAFRDLIGQNIIAYNIAQILGYVAFVIIAVYGSIGLYQLIKRKSIYKVDTAILLLGIAYIITGIIYLIFSELVVLNYRPIFIDGDLEASFPSSHTILAFVTCVTSVILINYYSQKSEFEYIKKYLTIVNVITTVLCIAIVFARVLSGVHWLTDIISGILYSSVITFAYDYFLSLLDAKPKKNLH